MKKFYIAANFLGAVEVRANSPEEAHAKASKFLAKKFVIQPKPTGLWVFEKATDTMTPKPDERISSGT